MLERRERDYLLGNTRVKMRSSVDNLEVGDFKVENLPAGENAEVPRWVADELISVGLAESLDEPFETEVFRALSREKMMGPLQLSGLPSDFYLRMRRRLLGLEGALSSGKARKEDVDRVRATSYDLVGMRLSKLLSLSSSSASVASLTEKLTPEEASFFAVSQSLSKEWKGALLGGRK